MPSAPHTPDERELEHLQALVKKGERARIRRDELALAMYATKRYSQDDIAARLDRADRRAGGDGVSTSAVQKILYRLRKARELASA